MGRQQYRVLQAMIALGTFTAQDLQRLSGVTPATIRTVIRRFHSDIVHVGQERTGRRGGQLTKYMVRHDRLGRLAEQILAFRPIDFSEVEEERNRLLDLTTAYDALVADFRKLKSADEQRQLLENVALDIDTARFHLESFPPEDPRFEELAKRIEEVNSLYLERKCFLERSEETGNEIARLGDVAKEATANSQDDAKRSSTFVILDAAADPMHEWSKSLCRDIDNLPACHTKFVKFLGDPEEIRHLPWEQKMIGGCFLTIDSSYRETVDIVPVMKFIHELRRLLPVMVFDAIDNSEFRQQVFDCQAYYFSHARTLDTSTVLGLYSQIVQSLRIAYNILADGTVRNALDSPESAEPTVRSSTWDSPGFSGHDVRWNSDEQ